MELPCRGSKSNEADSASPERRTPVRCALLATAGVLIAVGTAGCQSWRWQTAELLGRQPTTDDVMAAVNANAGIIQTLLADDVTITIRSGQRLRERVATAIATHLALRGRLAVRKPRYLRLIAGTSFSRELDLGSNDREFWLYVRQAEEPTLGPGKHPVLYHCTYEEYRRSGAELPLEPQWVIEALGIQEIDPTMNHFLQPGQRGTVELATPTTLTNGLPAVIVRVVTLKRGQVIAVRLERGAAVLAESWLAGHVEDPVTGAVVPTRVSFTWIPSNTTVTLKLRSLRVNPALDPAQSAQLWRSPYQQLVGRGLAQAINIAEMARRSRSSAVELLHPEALELPNSDGLR